MSIYKNDWLFLCEYVKEAYLHRTLELRGAQTQLFLTLKKPYGKVSKSTFTRWIKSVLEEAGVDTKLYKPGSVRVATVNKASLVGVPVDEILRTGGWTRESTFRKFDNKPVMKEKVFDRRVLELNDS